MDNKIAELPNDANFELAFDSLMKFEGGYSNHREDPGGATNFGISNRYLSMLKTKGYFRGIGDVKLLTKQDAKFIYKRFFWNQHEYYDVKSPAIGIKLLDMSVNMGSFQAHKLLQRALNLTFGNELKVDGIFGAKTLAALNISNPQLLLERLRSLSKSFYENLVKNNPKLDVFLQGWLKRADA